MEALTRRTAMTLGGASVLAGMGAAAALQRELWPRDAAPPFRTPGTPREMIQRRHLPNVPLVTHDGRNVRFYDDLVKDRKVVLTFFSSLALTESYKVTQNLSTLQRLFGRRIGADLFLYTIARNPERDTPAALRNWAAQSGAGPGWTFLSGRPADVERLRRSLGFTSDDPAEDADPRLAVGIVRYGSEPEMRWAHCQSQAKARVLAHSMLLDFGVGTVDPSSPIARRFASAGGPGGQAPVWNCRLLLQGVD
jgi:protein SCO1/2